MTKFADLHIHSHFSDGTFSPQDIVDEALKNDLSCISIADHDTTDAIKLAQEAARTTDLEIIPGVELSSEINGKDIHMLGYFIDCDAPVLKKELKKMQEVRVERIKKMVSKLKDQGLDNLEAEEVFISFPAKSIGRPHLAALLIQKKYVFSIKEAFDKYLAEGKPAYVKKMKLSPYEAINLIRKSGGIAVLAHPMVSQIDELIPSLAHSGLGGIEVFCPNCGESTIQYYEDIARKHNLCVTGGSDAHGGAKRNTFIGKVKVQYYFIQELKARKENEKK